MPNVLLSDQQADLVEPAWSAGSVGWNTSCAWDRKHVHYVFFAFYPLADVKAAVHEDKDGKFVLIMTQLFLMMTSACRLCVP